MAQEHVILFQFDEMVSTFFPVKGDFELIEFGLHQPRTDAAWEDESDLTKRAQAKVLAVRLVVQYCISIAANPDAAAVAESHINMLTSILRLEGIITESTYDP